MVSLFVMFLVYILIGHQLSLRMFWWSAHIKKSYVDFIMASVAMLFWPLALLAVLLSLASIKEVFFHHCEK